MPEQFYEIYVNTKPIEDDPQKSPNDPTRFQEVLDSVEIIPPISRDLAKIVRDELLHKLAWDLGVDSKVMYERGFGTSAYGFHEEGAKVNTIIKIIGNEEFGFGGTKEELEEDKLGYVRSVAQVISPSGNAIAPKR